MRSAPAPLVNMASRQPMLAERIARLYAQVGRGVLAARAERALPATLREFEAGVKALQAEARSPEIRENYRLLELLWIEYRPFVTRAPNVEGAERLLERHEEVAWIASKGVALMRDPRERADDPLREAGEARLQSQRIARLHHYRGWGTRSRNLATELGQSNAAYARAMDSLVKSMHDSAEVSADLALAANQYAFLQDAARRLDGAEDPRAGLESVAKTCDNILEVLERVARACEAVPA